MTPGSRQPVFLLLEFGCWELRASVLQIQASHVFLILQKQWRRKYHLMAIKHQFINQMAANKAGPTGHQNAFPILVRPELDLWITTFLGKMTQL